jgi:cytochrome c-type biogenesis protein CcmH/NrfG
MEMRGFLDALTAYEAFLATSETSDPRRLQVETVIGQLKTALGK